MPMTTWYGIQLNAEGCVSHLDLDGHVGFNQVLIGSGNGLNGELPNELWDLTELEQLSLSDGNIGTITGTIDDQLLMTKYCHETVDKS